MSMRDTIKEQEERIQHLEKLVTQKNEENDRLTDELASRAWPSEMAIEEMEKSIVAAAKKCVEKLRGMKQE